MSPRPIDPSIRFRGGDDPEGPGIPVDRFKEALSHWTSGVSLVSVRDTDGKVYATTVSSFDGLSADPPRILFSLGPGAQVLPFLELGGEFVVNMLEASQRRLAVIYADPFPVGPSPFPEEGAPVLPGSHAAVVCRTDRIVSVGASRLVIGLVTDAIAEGNGKPLLHYRREYWKPTPLNDPD